MECVDYTRHDSDDAGFFGADTDFVKIYTREGSGDNGLASIYTRFASDDCKIFAIYKRIGSSDDVFSRADIRLFILYYSPHYYEG